MTSKRLDQAGELFGVPDCLERVDHLFEVLAAGLGTDRVADCEGQEDSHISP
jgi:hypothetical protein